MYEIIQLEELSPLFVEDDATFPSLFCFSENNEGEDPNTATLEFSTALFTSSIIIHFEPLSSILSFVFVEFEELSVGSAINST